ncbi:MAG: hypothetical protein ACK2TT_03945 [Anaerolineales bacterium]
MNQYFSERKTVLIIALLVMLATSVPYLVGFGVQNQTWQFTGFVIGGEDGNSYIAKMLSGAAGSWLFKSPYSAEPQQGAAAFFPYLLLGKLTAPPSQHDQLVVIYHLFRFVAGMLAVFASYDFFSLFTQRKYLRYWGVILVSLGGGLGWIPVAIQQKGWLGSLPLDFISPESFGFLGLLGFPHLSAARAMLLWGMKAYLTQDRGWQAGLFWLGMGFFQPMYVPIAWFIVLMHTLINVIIKRYKPDLIPSEGRTFRQIIEAAAQTVLVSSPLVLYTVYSFLTDPYLKAWSRQNILPSPHWIHYLVAYGLVLPFAVAGIWKHIKDQTRLYSLAAVWLLAFPFLVSAPVTTQRRLAEGVWAILVACMIGFFSYRDRLPVYAKILTAFLLPTSLFLWIGGISLASKPAEPVFVPGPEVLAYQYLSAHAPVGSLVLSDFGTGNRIPAWAPVRVVLGHGPETVNRVYWQDLVDSSLNGTAPISTCPDEFGDNGIDYLFWGPAEKERWNFNPENSSCLKQIYNSGGYQIFQYDKSD